MPGSLDGDTVLVVGGINHDITAVSRVLPCQGETVLAHTWSESVGGKASNQAAAAALWGADVVLVARLGTDTFGDAASAALASAGVRTDYVVRDEAGTGLGLVLMDDSGSYLTSVVPRANADLCLADLDLPGAVWDRVGVVVLQLEAPIDVSTAVAQRARMSNKHVLLNASPVPDSLPHRLFEALTCLVVNEHEASALARTDVETIEDAVRAADLLAATERAVVVTLGALGAVVRDPVGGLHVATPAPVTAIDTLGAGDQFLGVLAAELATGASYGTAVDAAVWAAGVSVTRRGAQASYVKRSERNARGSAR